MGVQLLERAPAPQLADAGDGAEPPKEKLTAVAAEPPEGDNVRFNPMDIKPGDRFEEQVASIGHERAELDTAFANVVAGLGDVSLKGDMIIANPQSETTSSDVGEFVASDPSTH